MSDQKFNLTVVTPFPGLEVGQVITDQQEIEKHMASGHNPAFVRSAVIPQEAVAEETKPADVATAPTPPVAKTSK